ncbi:nucleotidyltransferase family protein [Pannonibacter sp. SL95]|uniref:nucleotidyltransferase family protein n=1 Tax=Pannonibacter sp. SL95 TaxID=2995153 RepID=UPI0022725B85|nr:GSU2403 family nucleotidyltransferase fold protein [Pannonibacter sp. SL95]MCY1704727.1 GSU2403 family nucleotidyltransferase fold protein [Pannonibacter sp. SL95]
MLRHSPISHAAYHDLLRSLLDEAVAGIRGTPTRVVRGGKAYWYDTYRVGTDVRKSYIGEDSEALQARIARHGALKEEADARKKERARLIRLLRAEGFLGTDGATGSLLAAMAGAGVFRLGGTVIGTHAFRLYEGELGVRYRFDQTAMTQDMDIASFERLSLSLSQDDQVSTSMQDVLSGFAFDPVPSLEPGQVWRWRQTRNDTLVEFLTPSFRPEEDIRPLEALGVSAQSLHYLNYLIASPIPAAVLYRSGVLVQIPRPERFALHKLIVADRRREGMDSLKSRKDRRQAEFLIAILLEDRPDDLAEALEDLRSRGPQWNVRLDRSLARIPETAARLHALAA